ncbi:hypothetical protein AWC38_SpisGene23788 [Stylophora pistillata]|uniref:Uncharacterized protein n=1 Tax=Stylophora pistillata TaxID=50429 RepID=A0A2B4R718_STYPI|nr:hypothetical protein AWC38_SpisGene23788 [Stylophora pistillata]
MDDQICTPPLQLTLPLHKYNNGDDIKDDYGQTLNDEDYEPRNALRSRIRWHEPLLGVRGHPPLWRGFVTNWYSTIDEYKYRVIFVLVCGVICTRLDVVG